MVDSLLWSALTEKHIRELETHQEAASVKKKLGQFLDVNISHAERSDVVLDFHFYNYAFCKDQGFPAEKTSVFFSILQRVVQQDTESNTEEVEKSFDRFKDMIFKHSVQRPPHSVAIFSKEDVGKIVNYIANSYYRHFNLYKFIFTKRSVIQLQQYQSCEVSQVRVARPLAEGMEHVPPPTVPGSRTPTPNMEVNIMKSESPLLT